MHVWAIAIRLSQVLSISEGAKKTFFFISALLLVRVPTDFRLTLAHTEARNDSQN